MVPDKPDRFGDDALWVAGRHPSTFCFDQFFDQDQVFLIGVRPGRSAAFGSHPGIRPCLDGSPEAKSMRLQEHADQESRYIEKDDPVAIGRGYTPIIRSKDHDP